ncbi:MAG: M28 family peptidase, partial [Candidatus Coatesbacteria bacterium]
MKWLLVTLTFLGLTQAVFAGDVFVLVEYSERGQAYDLLDDGWAVVEAHPSFCLILSPEEQAGAIPGGRVVADGRESLYVIWNPGNRPLPDIAGTRLIDVPGKAQILVARAADAMEYAMAGAELKRVNKTPIRKPVDARPLRTHDDKVPFADRYILEMIDKITPERYREIVETLSLGVTPSRYSYSKYIDAARDYVQTAFREIPDLDVRLWYYGATISTSEMHWANKNRGWVSGEGYVWRTDAAGESWTAYECNGDALDVVFTDVNNGFICGPYGFIAKTGDGGLTWTEFDISDHSVSLNSISFADPLNGITGGSNGIYYLTANGGEAWERGQILGAYDIRSVFYLDGIIWAAASEYNIDECQLYRSDDGGSTWEDLSGNFPSFRYGLMGEIWFHDLNNGVVIGEDEIYYTEDGGNTWTEAAGEYAGALHDIFFFNDKTGWITGQAVYRTDDGGKSWVECDNSPSGNFAVFFINLYEGWAFANIGSLHRTDDGGYTWEEIHPTYTHLTWENVIAEIEGTVRRDEVIIVCGHYDSLSDDPYRLAPGAEDNASGSGGVLAAAEAMAGYEYESTVRFITFSSEEHGKDGSWFYAEAMAERDENIVAVINMDMVAYLDEPVYDIRMGYNGFTELKDAVINAGTIYTPEIEIYLDQEGISDDWW